MNITIHRGSDQIGGCVTEYEHNGWRLFVDYGEQLPGAPKSGDLKIEGLTHGDLSKSALLITHYHGDHIGNIDKIPDAVPIYMGSVGRNIALAYEDHMSYAFERYKVIKERLEKVHTFEPGNPFEFGEFKIMPITIDHSAFDAYAFKIEAAGVSVFHTGDFRTHGFRSGKFENLIEQYVGKVNYIVCEGTNVARPNVAIKSEYDLQQEFEEQFREHKINVVYVSSTNIDRLFAMCHAANKAGRCFYVDSYQKEILDNVIESNKLWGKSRLYRYPQPKTDVPNAKTIEELLYNSKVGEFVYNDKFDSFLKDKGGVFVVRSTPRFNHMVEKLPSDDKQVYLSMWNGYLKEGPAFNSSLAEAVGKDYLYMHTSGHCDMDSIRKLIALVKPKAIIPIHTDRPNDFAELFCNEIPVIRLNDGETFSPVDSVKPFGGRLYDASILAAKLPEQEQKGELKWYALDERYIGFFKNEADAMFALQHVSYAPKRLLGYEIEQDDDAMVVYIKTLTADMQPNAEFKLGDQPADTRFNTGDKVWAIDTPTVREEEAVMPCTIAEQPMPIKPKSDYYYDQVVVNTLAQPPRMRKQRKMTRVFIFPYKDIEL
jgi:ribonuclease J